MIEWIVTSSAMILLVLLLRVLVKGRVSPRLRYALWGLVLLRLVIPVSLWESPVSVLRAAQASEGYQLASTLPTHMELYENGTFQSVSGKYDTFRMEPGIFQGEPSPPLRNAYGWVAVPSAEEAQALREQGQKAVNTTELKHLVDLQNLLQTVWQAGVWLSLLFLAAVNGRFALSLRRKRHPDGDYRGRPVFLADGLPSPCLFGLFRPAIYLTPEVAADDTARAHVLAHEYAHFRQGDHAWAIWRGVCLALHWYNPLVWLAAYLSRRDCELSCDEGAVRLLGEENRADYGRTLVGLVARRTTPKDLACCATTMTGGKSALKERIALLVKHPRTTAAMAVLVAAACAVFAVCTFTGAKAADEPSEPAEPVQTEREPVNEPAPEPVDLPEDLPTELMDLSRPAKEQGEWLLLAQTPGSDIALYRSAQDEQHVYLRVTNQSFQRFERDLTGMELLPTLEVVDGDADITVRALYRRYEGTYFNGTSNEPGIVADQIFYDWDEAGKYWTEWTFSTQPAQRLTEDLPALEDLPGIFGISGERMDEPMWWIGWVREENIRLYWAQYEEQMYLRYGEHIQKIDEKQECEWLPDLYFEDLDGDGDRELLVHYPVSHGTGVYYDYIAVYEWDGQQWHGTRHDPGGVIEQFHTQRIYRFYEDGTAFISYGGTDLFLDLSDLWESGYWETVPEICELSPFNTRYTYKDGQLTLTIAGELLGNGSPHLHGFAFDYVCPIYYSGGFTVGDGDLLSEFAAERPGVDASLLTPTFRDILRQFINECRAEGIEDLSTENFAICDVNGDGKDELITQRNNTYVAGQVERVYDADGNELLAEYPMPTYYDNGYVTAGWSHNQGVSGDKLWPYILYRYDGSAGKYVPEASVDGWDKSIRDTYLSYDETIIPFPDDVDKDGDGFVYYIITEDGGYAPVYGEPIDYADYALWVARYQGANRVDVIYYPLTEKNIALIG